MAVLLELTAVPAGPWSLDQLGWSEAMAEAVRARWPVVEDAFQLPCRLRQCLCACMPALNTAFV